MKPIEFWFSIGSTYSYLTVMRLDKVARETGADFTWRVFNIREILRAHKNVPYMNNPPKLAYMWRDLARRCGKYGLEASLPAPYTIDNLPLANQVALAGMREGWGKAYVIETYKRWFQDGQMAGSEPNLSASIRAAGQDPDRALALAESAEIVGALAQATAQASALGLFGAPAFTVEGELFWGDDRLDDALSWAREGRV